jgi:hypothetical protein
MTPLPCSATLLPILAAAASPIPRLWFLVPLVVVVSLVYSASRFESPERILYRAGRLCATILGFMALVFVILWLLSRGL